MTPLWFWEYLPPPTQVLEPQYVVGSKDEFVALHTDEIVERHTDEIVERHKDKVVARQRELERKKAEAVRRAQGELPVAAKSAIDTYLHCNPAAKSGWIAKELQENPATRVFRLGRGGRPVRKDGKPVLMTRSHLARKITSYRDRG